MNYRSLSWPQDTKITARTSTIRSSFIRAIIPDIKPSDQEIRACLKELKQDPEHLHCSYCGIPATEWDHFRPVVKDKLPTGYVTDIYNLVPACGKCNQSKGGKDWDQWIQGKAKHAPAKGADLDARVQVLRHFELWSEARTHKLSDLSRNSDRIGNYMQRCEELVGTFAKYQEEANGIKAWLEGQV